MDLIKEISSISNYQPSGGDLLILFQLCIKEEVKRQEAITFFPSNSYFRNLYKELKDRLLDGILLNSFEQLSVYQKNQLQIRRRSLESQTLILTGNKIAGIKIAEETLLAAEKHDLIEVVLMMSRELELLYTSIKINRAKYIRYRDTTKNYLVYLNDEVMAQSLFAELAFSIKKKYPIEFLFPKIEQLKKISTRNNRYKFRLYYYNIRILYAQQFSDSESIISICKEAAIFFKECTAILPYTTEFSYKFQTIPVYLNKGKFTDASLIIKECLGLPSKGSYNWHLTLLYKVVLGFYTKRRGVVIQAYKEAFSVKMKFDSEEIDERWKITRAYLALFEKIGQINFPEEFRTYRFINNTKPNDTAKVNMIVLELIHLLLDGKRKKYMNRVDNIENYIQTNLKGKENARSKYFLRALKSVELGGYNLNRVAEYAKKQIFLMKRSFININVNVLDSEPVPYEFLWEIVMDKLQRNK